MQYLYKPAFYAHILSSIVMLVAIVLFVINYKKIVRLDSPYIVMLLLVLSIAIANHSQNHIMLEKVYGYDPIHAIIVK